MSKLLIVALLTVFTAACQTTGFVTPTMSNKDFMGMTPEARAAYLSAVDDEHKVITAKIAVEYTTGRPIFVGDEKTGYTVQWDSRANLMHVYPGHKPEGMGVETFVAMTFQTDKFGVPVLDKDGKIARPIFVNAATQEDLTRSLLKIFAGGVPAALNGAVAAGITSSSQCKGPGCGLTVINDNTNQNRSDALGLGAANANAGAGVSIDSCAKGGGNCK